MNKIYKISKLIARFAKMNAQDLKARLTPL